MLFKIKGNKFEVLNVFPTATSNTPPAENN